MVKIINEKKILGNTRIITATKSMSLLWDIHKREHFQNKSKMLDDLNFTATSKTWTRTLDPDPEKSGPRKTLAQNNLDPEEPGPWKTWTLKSLDTKKRKKQLDVEKWIEDRII